MLRPRYLFVSLITEPVRIDLIKRLHFNIHRSASAQERNALKDTDVCMHLTSTLALQDETRSVYAFQTIK